MRHLNCILLCSFIMWLVASPVATAQSTDELLAELKEFKSQNPMEERNYTWLLSSTFQQSQFDSQHDYDMIGTGVILRAGILSIPKQWFYGATIDMQLGPYEFGHSRQLRVDYFGTGASLVGGFSFATNSPRMNTGGMISLNYMDVSGSSRGSNMKEKNCIQVPSEAVQECRKFNAALVENYRLRFNMLTLSPAYFIGWQKPIKSRSNHPDDLMTSINGASLAVGVRIPVYSEYSASFDYLAQQISDADDQNYVEIEDSHQRQNKKGSLNGYAFFIEFILNII